MKNILLIIFSLFLSTSLSAQLWWSDDAKWVYGYEGTEWPSQYLIEVYVDGTEVINNVICKVLKSNTRIINNISNDTTYVEEIYGYAFESGNKAWCFYDGDFIPIYDFDLNVVEIITLPLDDGSTVDLEVDQITEETVSGQARRVLNMRVMAPNCSAMDGQIIKVIEGIGVDATLLEGYQGPFIHRMLDCFVPDPFNLFICHSDTNLNYPEGVNCEQVTSVIEINNDLAFDIFPNPTSGSLQIDNKVGSEIQQIELFNAAGKFIINNTVTNNQIDVSFLKEGIYFLKVHFDNEQIGMKRFVKM